MPLLGYGDEIEPPNLACRGCWSRKVNDEVIPLLQDQVDGPNVLETYPAIAIPFIARPSNLKIGVVI